MNSDAPSEEVQQAVLHVFLTHTRSEIRQHFMELLMEHSISLTDFSDRPELDPEVVKYPMVVDWAVTSDGRRVPSLGIQTRWMADPTVDIRCKYLGVWHEYHHILKRLDGTHVDSPAGPYPALAIPPLTFVLAQYEEEVGATLAECGLYAEIRGDCFVAGLCQTLQERGRRAFRRQLLEQQATSNWQFQRYFKELMEQAERLP